MGTRKGVCLQCSHVIAMQKLESGGFHSNSCLSETRNMAEPDPGALNPEQRLQLRELKIQTRVSNQTYLRSHPEVELLLSGFMREVLLKRPENIREFASGYFTEPALGEQIREKMTVNAQDQRRSGDTSGCHLRVHSQ